MKKIVTISLIIFILIVGGIFMSGLVFNSKTNTTSQNNQTVTTALNNKTAAIEHTSNQAIQTTTTYDLAEVAEHNTSADCWMIIDGKVYDFTDYLNQHPDGPQSMTKYCGKDGTNGYVTKDKKKAQDHSAQAYAMLADYYKGDLK